MEKSEVKKEAKPEVRPCGWIMKSWATSSRCVFCRPGSSEIFRRAEASASGSQQSSAPPASAIDSRLREMAKRVSNVKK